MLDNISMLGGKNDLFVEGEGMIVKLGGTINIENVSFENLSNIKIPGLSWSGAINIINSKLKLKNVKISNTLGEDAINIVNSNSKIKDLLISNVPSDGLDIDFGTSDFSLIRCDNIGNDCLDTSGAKINGDMVSGNKIDDKLISIGEKSALSLNKLLGTNVNIGVAVKDSSIAKIENLFLTRANIDIAVFQKKPFFGPAELTVNNFSGYSSSERNNLVAENNILNINNKLQQTSGNSLEIEKLLYAN
jgi:hypothetical protein